MTKAITTDKYLKETIGLASAIAQSYLVLAERLKKIRDERLWEQGYTSFPEYLLELKISEANVSKMISVFEHYVVGLGIKREAVAMQPFSTMYLARKFLDTKEKADEFLADTNGLTRKDVEAKIKDIEHPDCPHSETYTVEICRGCGRKIGSQSP